MKKFRLIIIVAVLFYFAQFSAFGQDKTEQKKIIYTTLDIKQNYEIITIIAAPVDITSTISGSPVVKAYKTAWEQINQTAEAIKADAVIGVRIELENMNGQIVGRLLIYGTAVKFVEKTVEN